MNEYTSIFNNDRDGINIIRALCSAALRAQINSSEDERARAIKYYPYLIKYVENPTQEEYVEMVNRKGRNLIHVPVENQNEDMCIQAILEDVGNLEYSHYKTEKVLEAILIEKPKYTKIQFFPDSVISNLIEKGLILPYNIKRVQMGCYLEERFNEHNPIILSSLAISILIKLYMKRVNESYQESKPEYWKEYYEYRIAILKKNPNYKTDAELILHNIIQAENVT